MFRRFLVTLGTFAGVAVMSAALVAAGPLEGTTIDGVRCDTAEGTVFHVHQHLAIYDHGRMVPVPSDIGRPATAGCFYWIHTHTSDGIIHVESPRYLDFTLGEVFDIWQQPLSLHRVAGAYDARGRTRVWVNGSRYEGDMRSIDLAQHTDVTIEVGPPYHVPRAFTAWHGQ